MVRWLRPWMTRRWKPVCNSICMYVCVYVYMYLWMDGWTYVYMNGCMNVMNTQELEVGLPLVCMCVCVCVCVCDKCSVWIRRVLRQMSCCIAPALKIPGGKDGCQVRRLHSGVIQTRDSMKKWHSTIHLHDDSMNKRQFPNLERITQYCWWASERFSGYAFWIMWR